MRKEKLFAYSDRIRSRLEELGVALEDGPEGTRWRVRE
jgi:cysteinyl-tRNA synthetase